MLVLTDEQAVAELLDWPSLIGAQRRALIAFSEGRVIQPVRNLLEIEEGKRYMGAMPAVMADAMGLKLVCFYPGNAGTGTPTHTATVLLFDPARGVPLAVLDGRLITEMRTAAVSAAVTDVLASKGSQVLALIGSGVQAKAHLEALRTIRDFTDVRVWSRDPANAERFALEHGVRACGLQAAVEEADVVVAATSSREPLVQGAWLKKGAHVNSVGSPRPTWRELDDACMRNALIVDSREACAKEAGDVILSGAQVLAEAGEILSGKVVVDAARTTVFKSVGLAVEDVAAAKLVYDAYQQRHEKKVRA